MERIAQFLPGVPGEADGIVQRLRRPIPPGVTGPYVEAYTVPGEAVLLPYCQGPAAAREVVASGRRVLALNFDPLLVWVVRSALVPLPDHDLDAAVAHLGDSLKQGVPLRGYLEGLYTTTCPACLRPAVADYFVWDREQDAPVEKYVRCPGCDWDGRADIEIEDRVRLASVPVQTMHYHYVLDRVAPKGQDGTIRTRLESLLQLYSPRNLYALAELTIKIESLFPDGPQHQALTIMLLDCLDRCSSLMPVPGSKALQRGLSRPRRFLERNVWYAFEEAINRLRGSPGTEALNLSDTLEEFQTLGPDRSGLVAEGLVRDLPRYLPPRYIHLIVLSPPALDSAIWSLSYLWAAWLLGAEAATPLRPLLRQRTPDPAWFARVMSGSMRTLAGLLRDEGRLVLVLTGQRPVVVEALLLAASSARLGVASLVQSDSNYRLELTPTFSDLPPAEEDRAVAVSEAPLDAQIREAAAAAACEAIRVRGEPLPWPTLHAAMYRRLAEVGLLARAHDTEEKAPSGLDFVAEQVEAALEDPALERLEEREDGEILWWLTDPSGAESPLSDRVEVAAYEILRDSLSMKEADFDISIFEQFPGILTPEVSLVAVCLRAYGAESSPGYWQIRSEDLRGARRAERETMIDSLLALGKKLGYHTEAWDPFDLAWLKDGQVRAVFVVRWKAALCDVLALESGAPGVQPYLLIPGGRSALVSHKLSRNPLWQRAADEAGWRFIKYRHVRQLVDQPDINEYALQTIIGLDPIVEKEQAQLSLF